MTGALVRRAGRWAAFGAAFVPLLACSAAPHPATPTAPGPPPVPELREGTVVDASVHPGSPHVFSLPLEEGTYFELHLDRRRTELAFHVFEPQRPTDAPPGDAYVRGEPCPAPCRQMVWQVAVTSGTHQLRVEALSGAPVPYRLTVAALRPATERDRSRHRGLQVHEEALGLKHEGRNEEALERFLEARELFARGEYLRGVAATYSRRGGILRKLRRWDDARGEYLEAVAQWRRAGDPRSEAGNLVNLAGLELETAHPDRAARYLEVALALARDQVEARPVEGNALNEYCNVSVDDGRYDRAVEICDRAVELQIDRGRPGDAVAPLIRLANIHRYLGETATARYHLLRAQEILKDHPVPRLEPTVQNELAILHYLQGDYLAALAHYQEAQERYEALGLTDRAGLMLFSMGTTHQRLGDLETTLEYYHQALSRIDEAGDDLQRAAVLDGIGWVHIQRGDFEQAEALLRQVQDIARSSKRSPLLAAALERMGELHVAAGRPREAIVSLQEALALHRSSGSRWREPSILTQLAHARAALGDDELALELLFDAAATYEDIGRRSGVAESYYHVARLERDRGNLDAARSAAQQAVAMADSLRPEVGSQELRTLFSATARPYSELYIDILMMQHRRRRDGGHDAEALRESERGRARSLLEILPESDLDLREEVPEELLAERASIRDRLNAKELERQQLVDAGSADAGLLFRMKLDLEALLTDLQEVERRTRAASPRYAALTRPEPVTVGEIQRSLLDPETALLEYLLSEERSFLWVVTKSAFRTYELPGRGEIEARARCVHWLITAYGAPPPPEGLEPEGLRCLRDAAASYRAAPSGGHPLAERAHRRRILREAYGRAAGELSRTLLGPPARDGLLPFRLAVVSDGALEYVPFAALPSPEGGGDPLVVDHELVRLPSASVLAFQRSHPRAPREAAGVLAIVADPVYNLADPRIGGAARAGNPLPELSRLDFSGREADAIAAFAPPSRTLVERGFGASFETVTGGAVSGFRYVHFATHGVIDTRYPQLSSLVLSLVHPSGQPDAGGYLRLHDVYGLDLDDTDLVVLSACETALGREVRGEGLVGLTRGFLYAGAEAVVASLWQVQDLATAHLMERLYRGLLREGRSPGDALRQAQLATRGSEEGSYSFPYYWAGFVLQGEWR